MDSAFIHQAANELVQTAGTRNIKQIARSCSLDISETSRIKDMLGLLSLYFDKPLILINRQLNKQTKQMVCGYALGHYLEHQLLMDLHTLNKFLTIKDMLTVSHHRYAITKRILTNAIKTHGMAGSIFIDTALKEANLVHCAHDANLSDTRINHLLQEMIMFWQICDMILRVVDKTISPSQMKKDIRLSKICIRVFYRKQITVHFFCTIIHIVCFEIRGYNTVSIIKECLHNTLSEVTICARNQDFHLISPPKFKSNLPC